MYDFKLQNEFVEKYREIKPPFGYNGLGEFVYRRTYSRIKSDGTNEEWVDTVRRVVEGCYSIQKRHIQALGLGWNDEQGQRSAQEMFDRMFHMKFLPPGRGLWAMGTKIVEERGLGAALNNCGFVSTKNLKNDQTRPFEFVMDMSMLGVGVGFDTRGAGTIIVNSPRYDITEEFVIPDTREGWVESLRLLLKSFFIPGTPQIIFDYNQVRPMGELIKGFGGIASGPGPLIEMHETLRKLLANDIGKTLSTRRIVDIMNLIGRCVVSGNVRRSAELSLGDPNDIEYLDLKDYEKNPDRAKYGWSSNNSINATIGMDYSEAAKRTALNGEPGYFWLENAKQYSRMNGVPDHKDHLADGTNPCSEQTLESYEMCCLVEVFPLNHENKTDFLRTLKFAYLYGKTVTLINTHWVETNRIMLRNRRIGTSITDIARFIEKKGIAELKIWLDEGYDEIERWDNIYHRWLCVVPSIKKTTVKPSGTVSLLAGATPGVHYPESRFYIRRVRVAKNSVLLIPLRKAGFQVEDAIDDESSAVVSFVVDIGEGIRTLKEVDLWEQLEVAAFLQRWWSDNQVSVTVTFRKEEAKLIPRALEFCQFRLKSVSFLPKLEMDTPYKQMPYEEITEEKYNELISQITIPDFSENNQYGDGTGERYCTTDICELSEEINLLKEEGKTLNEPLS
ncbi:MAG: fused protease/ribonucleoside-triphosphate reductase [Candidatus Hodarchaeales archaeon]|jgi:adenosylcobalamin-dependent ribonucleoside-triphosphate reductase